MGIFWKLLSVENDTDPPKPQKGQIALPVLLFQSPLFPEFRS
jgi:hypothetical protein